MERLDAIVAGLGVVVLAAALGGVVLSGPAGSTEFLVGYTEQRTPLAAQQASVAGDGSADVTVPVGLANLTRVEFTVRVAGAGPRIAADAIEVSVRGPQGQQAPVGTGSLGGPGGAADVTVAVVAELGQAPAQESVRAGSAAEALARAQGRGTAAGQGAWTVTISIQGAGPGQLHAESHAIVVEAAAVGFQAVVLPPVANPR